MRMPSTKKITCVITGKPTVYSGDFLQKKITEYGSEENLNKFYICREVKTFLKKGYTPIDIRKIMNIEESFPLPEEEIINYITEQYSKPTLIKDRPVFNEALTGFTYNKSDPDVEFFINEYIIKS